jgi:signal transduction histidine kinase
MSMDGEKPTYEELANRVSELEKLLGQERRERNTEKLELLEPFIHNSPIYAYIKEVTPAESKVLLASENYIDMIGIPGSQMAGKTMEELFPLEFARKMSADDWSVVSKSLELKLDEDLNGRHYTTIKYPITVDGRNFLAGYTIDITELRNARDEIASKNEELLKLIAEKDKFFSIIAHDLRSPFNAFLGFTQLLVDELPDLTSEEIRKFAVAMKTSASNLYDLLENLLEWSRLQRGATVFDPTVFHLAWKVSQIIPLVKEPADVKNIKLETDVPEDLMIFADETMMSSVIRNLLSNAVKFTPKNGQIRLSAKYLPDDRVEIRVTDTGIGMNRDVLEKLFRLDRHPNRTGTDGEPSTGLGLILCRDFVEKHQGKLEVESRESNGSSFIITLPGQNGQVSKKGLS